MGLFNLFGKKKEPQRPQGPNMVAVQNSQAVGFEVPAGDREGRIYTYDGRPLKGIRSGSVFRMNVVPGKVRVQSIYTGAKGFDDADCCVTYGGYAVGYLSGGAYFVKQLVQRDGNVSITVKLDGFDEFGGWPLLNALLPDSDWFREELGLGVSNDKNVLVSRIYAEHWTGDVQDGWRSLVIRELPVPKGSQAKPHIEVVIDGTVCAELTARHGAYVMLSPLVGKGERDCRLKSFDYGDGNVVHIIEMRKE